MIRGKRNLLGLLFMAALMAVTGCVLLKGKPVSLLWDHIRHVKPGYLALGLALMFGYVGCEALCTWQILRHLGHKPSFLHCLGYSFAGFYVSSITPSATGGQPAQIYYMSRDEIPVSHGALNMMLIAACYQTAAVIWGGGVWLFFPSLRKMQSGGLGFLLLYGGGMMLLLTAAMVMFMFLPGPSRKLSQAVLRLLQTLRILRRPEKARYKLDRLLAEYNRGADCVKKSPGLALRVLLLCLLQQGLLFSVPWTAYLAFGLSGATWHQVAGLQALLTLAVCNLPLPGAVGPAEGGFVTAFTSVFGAELVTPAMLVSRGISFYAFLPISLVMTIGLHLRTEPGTRKDPSEAQSARATRAPRKILSPRRTADR